MPALKGDPVFTSTVHEKGLLRELTRRDFVHALGEPDVVFIRRHLGTDVHEAIELVPVLQIEKVALPQFSAALGAYGLSQDRENDNFLRFIRLPGTILFHRLLHASKVPPEFPATLERDIQDAWRQLPRLRCSADGCRQQILQNARHGRGLGKCPQWHISSLIGRGGTSTCQIPSL